MPLAEIQLSNIHVTYPAEALGTLKRVLPRPGVPLGHAPLEGVRALDGVTLEIGQGLYGLLGPNGAGKTTLMRAIAGLLEPTRGSVRLFGATHRDAAAQIAPLVGYLPQRHGLYDWMTFREYLDYFAAWTARAVQRASARPENDLLRARLARLQPLASRTQRQAAIERAAEEVHLRDVLGERLSSFSGGMKQRAGLARVLLQAPPLLIVDEPTAGLDPVERVKARLLLSQMARERTVIFSTHIVEDLEGACTSLGILSKGRLLYSGPPAELLRRWEGRVWEAPVVGDDPALSREALTGRGIRVLSRYAREGGAGWRCLADAPPTGNAVRAEVTLEDALLGAIG